MFAHCNSTLAFANGKWNVLHCSYSTKSRVRASKMKRCHQDRAQRAKTRPTAASEPSRLRKGGLLRFFCSIGAYEKPSGDSRARSLCLKSPSSIFGALGTPAKPNRNVPRNALLCLPGLFLFRASAVAKVRKTTLRAGIAVVVIIIAAIVATCTSSCGNLPARSLAAPAVAARRRALCLALGSFCSGATARGAAPGIAG